MYTEYTILQRMHSYVDESILLDTFKYNHFRCAWYSFLQLLDIDYSANYCCKLCGDRPDTLIMDATAVSFRKALDSWHSFVGVLPPSCENLKSGR